MADNKKPAIRFKGFTDAWEQREFGDVGSVSMCKRIFKDETVDEGEIPFYKIGTFGSAPDAYISRELYEEYKGKYSYPYKGDILLSASGTIGRIVEYNGEEAYFQDSNIVWLSHDKTISNLFLKTLYPIVKWNGIEGSTIKRLYNDNFLTTQFMMPVLAEQTQIGTFFSTLDTLITLHQRKYDKLVKVKKSMLEKMFPKNGSKFPKIRFKGFTDAWEQRKLGEVFTEYSEKNHEELSPLTIIQGKGTILREESNRNLIYDKAGLKNYKLVNEGDFILHLRSFEGGLEMANSRGIVSPAYHIFHGENADSRFYYPFFRSKYFISVLLKPHVYGIRDGKSIDVEGMKLIRIPCPKIEEQQLIGDYFETLDTLITLHQRKLEKLKNIKKSMLQKMFL